MAVKKSVARPNTNSRPQQALAAGASVPDPLQAVVEYTRAYVRQNPESAALWCLGIGFVLGWKLKPW